MNEEILNLHDNHLTGEIPVQLGSLQWLVVLDAVHNNPTELEFIDCWGNLLSGIIPLLIGNLRNLTTLDLTANQLTGGIPYEIGLLIKLRGLHLWGTHIGGHFPNFYGKFDFPAGDGEEARIIGRIFIPEEFGQLKNLRRLCISNNKLEGPVPDELSNLKNLIHLRASGNFLTGKLIIKFRKMWTSIHRQVTHLAEMAVLPGGNCTSRQLLEFLRDDHRNLLREIRTYQMHGTGIGFPCTDQKPQIRNYRRKNCYLHKQLGTLDLTVDLRLEAEETIEHMRRARV
ncbi:hypothetical protein R1flu_001157 [Riccia fluitans]|uniref:Uncharacterized protein n=1 Tax=Riccia fluitans TaxID=41844 RepID=A0ABD1Y2I6_9MARC